MAEVGVLSLQIHDNSDKAASGLNNLASALERVRSAVGGIKSLGTISKQIESINKAVRNASTSGTIENLNGLASALKRVKDAASGLDLSKLSMPANTNRPGKQGARAERKPAVSRVNDAVKSSAISPIDQKIEQTLARARELSAETARVTENLQSVSSASHMSDGFTEVKSTVEETNQALDEQIEKLRQANRERNEAENRARLERQYPQFRELYMSGEAPWTSQVPQMYGVSGDVIEKSETYAEAMRVITEEAERAQRAIDAVATAFQNAMSTPRLGSGQSPLLLGAGGVSQENALSTWVDSSAQWKPNWGEPNPEMAQAYALSLREAAEEAERIQSAIEATASAFQGMTGAPRLGSGQNPLLLGAGGVPQENALSTWIDSSEQWKPDWTGGGYNQGLIIGEGYVSDAEEVSETALSVASAVQESTGLIIASTADAASGVQESTGLIVASATNTSGAMDQVGDSATNASDAMGRVKYGTDEAQVSLKDLLNATDGTKTGMHGLIGEAKSLSRPLSNLASQLWNVAKRMAMRAVIRAFVGGIKEGVENLYWYSKAVGTSFAPAMDNAASSMLLLRNSIGAMLGPLIESLVPVLQTVVNWLVTAINYANQFFSLLAGKNGWTKAVPVAAEAFEKTSQSTKSAAKEMKDLLADWDELNIIQSESGDGSGGGGGKKAQDYASMFEEVNSYNEGIASFFKNLEESFGSILDMVKLIGAGILAWKISNAFGGVLGAIAGLVAAGIVLDITFKLVRAFDNTYADTGKIGWLVADVLTTLIGATLMKGILFKVLGGTAAKISLPLTFAVSAAATIKATIEQTDLSALDPKTINEAIVAALKGGAAVGLTAMTVGGVTKLAAAGAGLSGALITFGITMGLKATSVVVDTGEITKETILADVASAVSTALGVAGLALAFGASAPVVAAAAAGALLFTAAATIGVQAVINANKDVTWGKQKLTAKQIEDFVNDEMYSINVNTTAKIITDKVVTPSAEERAQLETNLTNMLGDWKIIQLGIAGTEDYENLQKDVDAVVEDIQTCINTAKEAGKLTLQFIPTLAGETEEEQTSWLTSYSNGWTKVDEFATTTGKRIGELISKAENNALEEGEPELLKTLMDQMSRVASSVAVGKIGSEAFGNMLFSIGDINQASFDQIASKYADYQNELRTGLMALANEQLAHQGSLVAALYEIDPNSKEYQDAVAKYRWMSEHLMETVEDGVREYSKTGKDWLTKFLKEKYVNPINQIEAQLGTYTFSGDFAFLAESRANGDINDNRALADAIDKVIQKHVWFENEELARYLEKTGIDSWSILTDNTKASIREAMENALGDKALVDEIIQMWEGSNPVEEAISQAEEPNVETSATVDATVKENVSYETIDEAVDAGKEALGNLPEGVGNELASTDDVISTHTFPATNTVDTSATTDSFKDMRDEAVSYMNDVVAAANTMDSILGGYGYSGVGGGGRFSNVTGVTVSSRATGGNIRSGEMFFANENGNIEMMGKMGHSPVVANNQQIVDGISKGVAASNSGMESAMNMMVTLMRQFVNKEFTAKVVPSSSMGRNNAMSSEAYRKVTG